VARPVGLQEGSMENVRGTCVGDMREDGDEVV
jgi:hypothetical protein